eukprot:4843634-Amphidinium_carterae.2
MIHCIANSKTVSWVAPVVCALGARRTHLYHFHRVDRRSVISTSHATTLKSKVLFALKQLCANSQVGQQCAITKNRTSVDNFQLSTNANCNPSVHPVSEADVFVRVRLV